MEKPPRPVDITSRVERRTRATRREGQGAGGAGGDSGGGGIVTAVEQGLEGTLGFSEITKSEEEILGVHHHKILRNVAAKSCLCGLFLVVIGIVAICIMPSGYLTLIGKQKPPHYVPYVKPTKPPADPVADAKAAALYALTHQATDAENAQTLLMSAATKAEWTGFKGVLDNVGNDLDGLDASLAKVQQSQDLANQRWAQRSAVVQKWIGMKKTAQSAAALNATNAAALNATNATDLSATVATDLSATVATDLSATNATALNATVPTATAADAEVAMPEGAPVGPVVVRALRLGVVCGCVAAAVAVVGFALRAPWGRLSEPHQQPLLG